MLQFFAANPMLDSNQVGPIVDWVRNQRFIAAPQRIVNGVVRGGGIPQPGLSMKGRTGASVLRLVEQWHRDLNCSTMRNSMSWPACGIPGYERVEGTAGSQTIVRIDEILTSSELQQEGRAMRHCVASYAGTCGRGTSAIYSLKQDNGSGLNRRLTIQLDVRTRRIVQARGRLNDAPLPLEARYLRNWATAAGLTAGSY